MWGIRSKLWGTTCRPILVESREQMKDLEKLDRSSSSPPWTADKFREELQRPHMACHGVYSHDGELLAYALVRLGHPAATLTYIVVKKTRRRSGIGKTLVNCLDQKFLHEYRHVLQAVADDADLDLHLFLKSCGFKATEILPGPHGDKYVFCAEYGFSKKS